MQILRKWLIKEAKVVAKWLGYLDYESTALFLSVPKKSFKFNTFKHLNLALVCPEWTGMNRRVKR